MEAKIIAHCGLVCSDCAAYIATQAGDRGELEQVVQEWKQAYGVQDITVDQVICDGCLSADGRHCYHCAVCEIRACAVDRGVLNCGHCPEYACERLKRFFGSVPDAQSVLDQVHNSI